MNRARTVSGAGGRDQLMAHLAMILFACLIAGSFSLGKLVVPFIDPVPLNAARFLIATLVLGAIAFGVRGHPIAWPKSPWRFGVLGGLMAVYFVTMFVALTLTQPVSTSAVFTLIPIMTAFFGYLILRQVVRPIVGLSLLVAGLGSVWVIFRGDWVALRGFDIGRGELIYFVGCVCHAIYAPLVRKFNRGEPLVVLTFFTVAATGLWIIAYGAGAILDVDWGHLPPLVWWTLAYLAIFPTAITFFLVQYATSHLPSSKVLAYGYLTPIVVIMLEGLAGHGWVSMAVLMGAVVTCGGLIVLYFAPDQ